jgi:hypothetical protein
MAVQQLGHKAPSRYRLSVTFYRSYLTVILSCVYAVFIVTLGVVIYVSDIVLRNGTPLAEVKIKGLQMMMMMMMMMIIIIYYRARSTAKWANNRNSIMYKNK